MFFTIQPARIRHLVSWFSHIFLIFSVFCCFTSHADSLRNFELSLNKSSPAIERKNPRLKKFQINNIQNSVWKINNVSGENGTAFSISPNRFVTNFHVLEFMLKKDSLENIFLQKRESSSRLKIKKVVAVSALYDLALFETREDVSSYVSITDVQPHPHEDLLILGFPFGKFVKLKNTGSLVAKHNHYVFPVNHFRLDGTSGSSIFNTRGQVIGVVSLSGGNIVKAVKSTDLKRFISGDIGWGCSDFISSMECIKKEIENLKALVEQDNHFMAQFYLGWRHYKEGKTGEKFHSAFELMFKSASQGYAPAQFILGLMCLERKRTKKDLEQAVYWLGKAADQDYAEARFVLGEIYLYKREATKKDLELAFELMFKSAKQGYALAQFYLGLMYLHGEGVKPNSQWAVYWIQKSASQGYAPAQFRLGLMYLYGEGVIPNFQLALYWIGKSADQDYVPAQSHMEWILEEENRKQKESKLTAKTATIE